MPKLTPATWSLIRRRAIADAAARVIADPSSSEALVAEAEAELLRPDSDAAAVAHNVAGLVTAGELVEIRDLLARAVERDAAIERGEAPPIVTAGEVYEASRRD